MIDRRTFLLNGTAAIIGASQARAQSDMDSMPMPGMDGTQSGHGGMDMTGAAPELSEGEELRELPRLANQSSQAGSFESNLNAEPATARFVNGLETPVLSYNGQGPGLLIEAMEGDKISIVFGNRIPGEPSTIHWHGMPVPADQDGNPMDPVASGSDRQYTFELPEGSAGTYWYHPHPHGFTAQQVYRGLAGAFIVKPRNDPIPAAYGDTPLFFTDLRLASDGTIPPNTMADLMNGRIGDNVLVNGQKNPVLKVSAGARRRFRLFNTTNARFLRLSFGDLPMTIIGTDGGLLETPVVGVQDVLLAPAERLDIVVDFDAPGTVALATIPYDHGWMGGGKPPDESLTLMTVDVAGKSKEAALPLPIALRTIPDLGTPAVTRKFVFGEKMGMNASGMTMDFFINGVSFDMNRIDLQSKVGQVERWEIENPTDMDHPFHVHGTQFQLIDRTRNGTVTPAPYRAWKDTVNIARGETIRILLRQDKPGLRMYHCHILEHEQLGMMGVVDVRA